MAIRISREDRRLIGIASRRYGVAPHVLAALIEEESHGDPNAVSPAGAFGETQFMPGTAKGYHVRRGSSHGAKASQILGAAHYLRDLGYKRNRRLALAEYNAGPGNPGAGAGYASQVLAKAGGYYKRGLFGGGGKGGPNSGGGRLPDTLQGHLRTIPGVDRSAERQQLKLSYLGKSKMPSQASLLNLAGQLRNIQDTPPSQAYDIKRVPGRRVGGIGGGGKVTKAKGTRNFEGTRVAGWIYPILLYARHHGWKGKVNSGFRSFAEQTRIYNSGVRPAARPGTSNHEGANFPRGAVDVSNAAQLSSIIRRSPYRHVLVWAGGKDPVHFSHPHGGSY